MPFYHLPHPYNPGYAIPDYVLAEPPGRGTFTTAWLPRGTISQIVPDFLAKPGKKLLGRDNAGLGGLGSLGDTVLDGSSLDEHTLATPTLSGDTLGARKYTLESLGSLPGAGTVAAVGIAGLLLPIALIGGTIYFLTRKKSRKNPARRRRHRARRARRSRQ